MALELQLPALPRPQSAYTTKPKTAHESQHTSATGTGGVLGRIVLFEDGSWWRMTKELSPVKYQQGEPPFEARQVFECVCIKDPNDAHVESKEAVAKVKYQVHGTAKSIIFYWEYAWSLGNELNEAGYHGVEVDQEAINEYDYANQLYHLATHGVLSPHSYTVKETDALEHFRKEKCENTPHLLSYSADYIPEGFDTKAMSGGYVAFILMTKVPGEALNYEKFWAKDQKTREDIRRAFKAALMDVWKCSVKPYDPALRNLIWDEKSQKCYIVDFEDYGLIEDEVPEHMWTDARYRSWGLAEECRSE